MESERPVIGQTLDELERVFKKAQQAKRDERAFGEMIDQLGRMLEESESVVERSFKSMELTLKLVLPLTGKSAISGQ